MRWLHEDFALIGFVRRTDIERLDDGLNAFDIAERIGNQKRVRAWVRGEMSDTVAMIRSSGIPPFSRASLAEADAGALSSVLIPPNSRTARHAVAPAVTIDLTVDSLSVDLRSLSSK